MIHSHDIEDESDEDEEDENTSEYQWCLHCERAYRKGEHRMVGDIPMCPYQDCNGDVFMDGWDWDKFREPLPQYPEIPEFGVKYPMYPSKAEVVPTKAPEVQELSPEARKILEYLVVEMRRGRFLPSDPTSFCGYKETHDALDLKQVRASWGNSLRVQGLEGLALWIKAQGLPAITGLIVAEAEPRLPGSGYYRVNDVPDDSTSWWNEQIKASILHDWSIWVPDLEGVSIKDLNEDSRTFLDGVSSTVTKETRQRCNALRLAAKSLFRCPDGLLRCKVCGWHKPEHGMVSGDIVELHHIDPVSQAPQEGTVVTLAKAAQLLVPVCPNCHRMIHSRTGGGQFELDALKQIITEKRETS